MESQRPVISKYQVRVTPAKRGSGHKQTPRRDGTTQVAFDPVDFIARLAALVPQPRINLTRYHGVLAPNHRWRVGVTPAKRGKALKTGANAKVRTPAERHAAMTWTHAPKRVFKIDIEVCSRCGGGCLSHRRGLEPLHRGAGRYRPDSGSSWEQDTEHPRLATPSATDQSVT